jgi:hypothetical protein
MPDGSKQKDDDKPKHKEPRSDDRSKADLIEGVEDYYEAVDKEDWTYTYQHLDSRTQAMYTEEEWHFKNQWYADTERLELATMDVRVNDPVSDTVVGVTVKRTFKDGTPWTGTPCSSTKTAPGCTASPRRRTSSKCLALPMRSSLRPIGEVRCLLRSCFRHDPRRERVQLDLR